MTELHISQITEFIKQYKFGKNVMIRWAVTEVQKQSLNINQTEKEV
jgi:acyl-CoA thioesterase FadM